VFQYFQTRLEKRLSKGYVRGAATPAAKPKETTVSFPGRGGGVGGGGAQMITMELENPGGAEVAAPGDDEGRAP